MAQTSKGVVQITVVQSGCTPTQSGVTVPWPTTTQKPK